MPEPHEIRDVALLDLTGATSDAILEDVTRIVHVATILVPGATDREALQHTHGASRLTRCSPALRRKWRTSGPNCSASGG
jgi:hypothetical protein